MTLNFPNDFYCYSSKKKLSDENTEKLINEAINIIMNDYNKSVVMRRNENTEVIVIRQYRNDIKDMAFRVLVLKDYYEKILPYKDNGIDGYAIIISSDENEEKNIEETNTCFNSLTSF